MTSLEADNPMIDDSSRRQAAVITVRVSEARQQVEQRSDRDGLGIGRPLAACRRVIAIVP